LADRADLVLVVSLHHDFPLSREPLRWPRPVWVVNVAPGAVGRRLVDPKHVTARVDAALLGRLPSAAAP
jgi:hypothetical protein